MQSTTEGSDTGLYNANAAHLGAVSDYALTPNLVVSHLSTTLKVRERTRNPPTCFSSHHLYLHFVSVMEHLFISALAPTQTEASTEESSKASKQYINIETNNAYSRNLVIKELSRVLSRHTLT